MLQSGLTNEKHGQNLDGLGFYKVTVFPDRRLPVPNAGTG